MGDKTKLAAALQNPNVQKMLDLLGYTEGTDKLYGYKTLVGGKRVDDLSKHPNIVGLITGDGPSTAFGRYQIIGTTWRGLQKRYGFTDFSPHTQDLAAVALLKDAGALTPAMKGDFVSAINRSKDVWVSLPGSTTTNQGERSWRDVNQFLGGGVGKLQQAKPATSMGGHAVQPAYHDNENSISTFQRALEASQPKPTEQIASVYQAYKSGKMNPAEKAEFEQDVKNGHIMLPRGASLTDSGAEQFAGAPLAPQGVLRAYQNGDMTRQEKMDFEQDVRNGGVKVPQGFQLQSTEPLGVLGGIKEAFTGNDRKTAQTEALPDWTGMPELSDFMSAASWKTAAGTMFTSPDETIQVIKANYPSVEVTQDGKGNYLLKSSKDGQMYAIKPGFQFGDIPRVGGAVAAFTPAGRATTFLGAGAASAGTQAIIEGSQAVTGGTFDPKEVAMVGALGAATPVAINAAKAVAAPIKNVINPALGREAPIAADAMQAVKPGAQATVESVDQKLAQAADVPPAAPAPEVPPVQTPPIAPMTGEELGATARKAAEGGLGSKQATQVLAEQAAPNAKTVEAAKRLGVEDFLQPDHVTTNQAYRELAQAVKSIPGSQARAAELHGLEQVAKRADDLVTEVGGTGDLSMLDANVKSAMRATQQELDDKAASLYGQLRENIPAKAEAPAPNVLNFINQRADELGGISNLTPMERTIFKKLSPSVGKQPTYALLDDVRRDLTAARIKGQGAFKDADAGLIKKLELELKKDQAVVVEQHGMGDTFKAAQSAVAIRKGLEDDMKALFGRELDKSMTPALASATKALPAGDAAKFIKLLKSVPEEQRQQTVAAGLLTAFGKNARNGSLNFTSYSSWYEGLLRNKQSYAALMANLPAGSRKQLSDLYRVSKGISQASKERITTGRIQAVADQLKGPDTLLGNVYSVAKRSMTGVAAEAVTTPIGLPGSGLAAGIASALTKGKTSAIKAADALIASPEFQALTKAVGTPGEKAAVRRVAYSKEFTRFVKAIGNPQALKTREKFLVSLLQATNNLGASYE